MDAFLLSTLTVAIAELGDRSLFLALLFGLRYQRPWPVFAGMALGLFLNQALSALVGIWLFQFLQASWHSWLVGIAFLAMAVWVLIPEKDDDDFSSKISKRQLFFAALIGFFVLEMADKTQLVVVTLAGSYQLFWPVVLGATLGILLVTAPALWLGYRFANKIPLDTMKWVASGLFFALGVWVILGALGVTEGSHLLEQWLPLDDLMPSTSQIDTKVL